MPLNEAPSGSLPDASIGLYDSSTVRHRPMASKFSNAKPVGSIMLWHELHAGLERCCASRSRTVLTLAWVRWSLRAGTFGGGSGGGVPKILFRTHLPRITGEVRIAGEVIVKMLPCPSRPRLGLSAGSDTRRKLLPWMPDML